MLADVAPEAWTPPVGRLPGSLHQAIEASVVGTTSEAHIQAVGQRVTMSRRTFALLPFLAFSVFALAASAETQRDRRVFPRVVHSAAFPREVSVYLELPRPAEQEALLVPLWSGITLRVLPIAHREVESGVFAYSVQLLSEELGGQPLLPTDQPAHGSAADVIAAFQFRNRENSGANAPGPLNLNAPGELRILRYPMLTLEIRVLAFEILNARPGLVPSFSSLRLLVIAREVSAA